MDVGVKKNRFGYYELIDKPNPEDLKKYYAEKYYQDGKGGYQTIYSEEELLFIKNKIAQKFYVASEISHAGNNRFLDS